MMKAPIFIIGNPRSGTTLLRLMLTCHKDILIPPECGFAVWYYDKYHQWQQPECDGTALHAFIQDLMLARKIEHWELDPRDLLEFLRDRRPSSYAHLVSCVYEWYGISRGMRFKRWGDKNNFHLYHIATIQTMFPDAQFVHIVRDGRDVACSYKSLDQRRIDLRYAPRLPGLVEDAAQHWAMNIRTIIQSFDQIGWNNVIEVRFEDLIVDTESTLKILCAHLSEDYDPAMLTYHTKNEQLQLEPLEYAAWKAKNLRPPIPTEIGRYKSELSEREVQTFEAIAGRELGRYGYLTTSGTSS